MGASALTASFASFAQPQGRVWRIGFLVQRHLDLVDSDILYGPFRQGLQELGYVEGKNLIIEWRSAEGNAERLPGLAAELVRLAVDIIVAFQTPAVHAAKQATNRIPIVIAAAGDPVATGIVASLARPGGNITGMSGATTELAAKMLDFIREIRPGATRVAVLANANDLFTKAFLKQIQAAARRMGIELRPIAVRGPDEFDAAFAKWRSERVDAVIVQPSLPGKPAIELAAKHHIIVTGPTRAFAEEGGLLSYSASPKEQFQRVAVIVDKIFKGAKPADLPVEQPTKYDLVINMKTAKALGIRIPNSILVQATKLIE